LRLVLTDVANELRENGALDEEECFIDATANSCAPALYRALVERPKWTPQIALTWPSSSPPTLERLHPRPSVV
jgi:hypothetical protein